MSAGCADRLDRRVRHLDELAASTSRPARILGMHFFSAENSRLLEVVRGGDVPRDDRDGDEVCKDHRQGCGAEPRGDELIADRVMGALRAPDEALLVEGLRPDDVDRAIYDFGFPTGPFQ